MKLAELAREAAKLDAARFQAQYPEPALVFDTGTTSLDSGRVDTPTGLQRDKAFGRTSALAATKDSLKSTDAFPVIDESLLSGNTPAPLDLANPAVGAGEALIVFLKKSTRNPFASMITVGRAPNNDICLPISSISKVHCYFTKVGTTWKLTDQRATNGTYVDGQRIQPGASLSVIDGARISFGPDSKARFYTPEGLFGCLALFRAAVAT